MAKITEFNADIFTLFDEGWALLTAGTPDDYNTMTISWGQLGTLWHLPVATVFVKPLRYTHEFMDRHEIYTVSFYPESCRRALSLLGSRSGRDGNKIAAAGLTPLPFKNCVTFKEAKTTLVCKKIFRQDLAPENIPTEMIHSYYESEAPHTIYIGEVLELLENGK